MNTTVTPEHVASEVEYYASEYDMSESEAIETVADMIGKSWKETAHIYWDHLGVR